MSRQNTDAALFRIMDLIPILLTVAGAVGVILYFLYTAQPGTAAVIRVDGTVYARVDLQEDREFVLESGDMVVEIVVGNGEAYFRQSDCPDQICVQTGALSRAGETAVCLPARISLTIEGEEMMDAVTY